MKTQRDKWQALPHRGAMRREAEIPVAVSDKGACQPDENQILSDAQEVSGGKLTWMRLSRARRWRKAPITAVPRRVDEWIWCIARVTPAARDLCGIAPGKRWTAEVDSPNRVWVSEMCTARSLVEKHPCTL